MRNREDGHRMLPSPSPDYPISTSMSLSACPRPGGSSKLGAPTTTPTARTPACAGSPPTSSQPAPGRTTTRTDSGHERGQIGGKVTAMQSHALADRYGAVAEACRHSAVQGPFTTSLQAVTAQMQPAYSTL